MNRRKTLEWLVSAFLPTVCPPPKGQNSNPLLPSAVVESLPLLESATYQLVLTQGDGSMTSGGYFLLCDFFYTLDSSLI